MPKTQMLSGLHKKSFKLTANSLRQITELSGIHYPRIYFQINMNS